MKLIYVGSKQKAELWSDRKKAVRPLHIVQFSVFALLVLIPIVFKNSIFKGADGDMSPVAYVETVSGTGSAVYIGGNKLLTAAHVVDGMELNDVCGLSFQDPNDPDAMPVLALAEIMAKGTWSKSHQDPSQDYALLHIITIDASKYVRACNIGISSSAKVKDEIFVEGFPAGAYMNTSGNIGSLAAGDQYKYLFVVDAQAWHGNSGGALFDKNSNLLGIVTMAGMAQGLNDGQTYVLKIDHIKNELNGKGFQL